ncbi:hypothetical protein LCGC14_2153290 [marine sediment metagenome]|uniref:Uncharacterized protein n=1 Tax=marine sediment metagenome TaxID=412755 RepID=A0A0F9GR96_9ZZZZ
MKPLLDLPFGYGVSAQFNPNLPDNVKRFCYIYITPDVEEALGGAGNLHFFGEPIQRGDRPSIQIWRTKREGGRVIVPNPKGKSCSPPQLYKLHLVARDWDWPWPPLSSNQPLEDIIVVPRKKMTLIYPPPHQWVPLIRGKRLQVELAHRQPQSIPNRREAMEQQDDFVSFTEVAVAMDRTRMKGKGKFESRSDDVTWAINLNSEAGSKRFVFRIMIGANVCKRARFKAKDRIDVLVNSTGQVLIKRCADGRYTLGPSSDPAREKIKKNPDTWVSLIATGRLYPGMPYYKFEERMSASVVDHYHTDLGLVLKKLPRHPNAEPDDELGF